MKNLSQLLIQAGFILGFSLPYAHLAWLTSFDVFILLLLETLLQGGLASIFVGLGFGMVAIQALRGRLISVKLYELLFFSSIMILMVVPSLAVPVLVFLAPKYIMMSISLYFTGLTTIVVVAPLIIFFYQSDIITKVKGGVTAPAVLTLSNYVMITLLSQALIGLGTSGSLDVTSLGVRILGSVVASANSLLQTFAGSSTSTPYVAITNSILGASHLVFLTSFSIVTALYVYQRLSSRGEPQEGVDRDLAELVRGRLTLHFVGASLLAAALAAYLFVFLAGSLLQSPASGNIALVIGVVAAFMALFWAEKKAGRR
ncbi:MAG: hypothetical protein HYU39_05655 [Thaumarchaeota archaeon]|nr:hypothetical protein [Nitrososphaerota archaeon]